MQYLLFSLAEYHFGFPVASVARVVPVVEISPIPTAPDTIMGVINVQGTITSVVDLSRRFQLPPHVIRQTDHLILLDGASHPLALLVDGVHDVIELRDETIMDPQDALPAVEQLRGVAWVDDRMVLLCDWDDLLAVEHLFSPLMPDNAREM